MHGSSSNVPLSRSNTRMKKPPRNRGRLPLPVLKEVWIPAWPWSIHFWVAFPRSGRDIVRNDIPSCSTRLRTVLMSAVALVQHRLADSSASLDQSDIRLFNEPPHRGIRSLAYGTYTRVHIHLKKRCISSQKDELPALEPSRRPKAPRMWIIQCEIVCPSISRARSSSKGFTQGGS
jgi:hypothetical protein